MTSRMAHSIAGMVIVVSLATTLANTRYSPFGSANPKSRFATIESLVERGTFVIDKSPYKATMDRIKKDGHLYSTKPPLLPTVASSVYWLEYNLLGWTLDKHEHRVVRSTIFFWIFLPHALMLLMFWLLARRFSACDVSALVALMAAAFTWIGVGYATDIQNHSIAGALGIIALYSAHRFRAERTKRFAFCAGLFAALLCTADLSSAPMSVAVFVYCLWPAPRRAFVPFAAGALPPLITHFALTYSILGTFLPAYVQQDLYERHLPEFDNTIGLGTYFWNAMLFGHHGLLILTPAVAFGLYAASRSIFTKGPLRPEALTLILPFLVTTAIFMSMNRNYGGTCVGFRWLIPSTLWLLLFVAPWWAQSSKGRLASGLILVALLMGRVAADDATKNPWHHSTWDRILTGAGPEIPFHDRAKVIRQKKKKRKAGQSKKTRK